MNGGLKFHGMNVKKVNLIYIFIILISLNFKQNSYADENSKTKTTTPLEQYKQYIKNDQYNEAIEFLKTVDEKAISHSQKTFYTGICYARTQKFDEAIKYFQQAIKEDNQSPELYYEYGQALYAANNLKEARNAFLKSATRQYNYTASIYYVAYSSELLNDFTAAKYNYVKLIKDSRTDKKILQVSLYQYTRILLLKMRQTEKTLIKLEKNLFDYIGRYVLPLLHKAYEVDKESQLAAEIKARIKVLEDEVNFDPNVMVNGRRISPNHLFGYVTQRLKYDTNVSLTKNASASYETEAYIKYDFVQKKKWIMTPDLRVNYTKYKDHNNSDVFQNDSVTASADVRNKVEHTLNGHPASLLLDLEYSTLYKDWNRSHQKLYYSRNYAAAIGELFSIFNSGETSIKFKQTHYTDISLINNSNTRSLTIEQYTFLREGQHLLITDLDVSTVDYYQGEIYNNDTYSLRFYYLMFEFIPTCTLQLGLSTVVTAPKNQYKERGLEITFNPSIDLSKTISDKWRISVNYNYTNNSSKLSSYTYHKQVVGSELSYNF